MCCFYTLLVFLGPRFILLVWSLLDPMRFSIVFPVFIWPFLGLIFFPWTTLIYVLVWTPLGIIGFSWVWLALAFLADLAMYGGGAYGNRDRMPGYTR